MLLTSAEMRRGRTLFTRVIRVEKQKHRRSCPQEQMLSLNIIDHRKLKRAIVKTLGRDKIANIKAGLFDLKDFHNRSFSSASYSTSRSRQEFQPQVALL